MSGLRRILSIDGGGIKGVLPASFLAQIEQVTGERVVDHFDLIAGTSTGGIIAMGLALGLPASAILDFYRDFGPQIFGLLSRSAWASRVDGLMRTMRRAVAPKHPAKPLREALERVFGDRCIGECLTRVIVPAYHGDRRSVYVFKTSHHPRFEFDYREKIVDALLATAAAPTYLPPHQTSSGAVLIDGGVWANNPAGMAAVEAVGVLGWKPSETRLLSLGCGDEITIPNISGGIISLGLGALDLLMQGQAVGSLGSAKILLGPENIIRIDPSVPKGQFRLDDATMIDRLAGIGAACAREALPELRKVFLSSPREEFVPHRRVVSKEKCYA
jgi:uncharacterized protein